MTRILFLHGATDRLAAAAHWLGTAIEARRSILVWAPVEESAERLDRLLWTREVTGFVPHVRAGSPLAAESPIVITGDLTGTTIPIPHDQVLLNLADVVPPGYARFDELVEVVSTDDTVRLPARERFKFYRDHGHTPQSLVIAAD